MKHVPFPILMGALALAAALSSCAPVGPADGIDGIQGPTGTVGPQGPTGNTGATGPSGINATPVTVVPLCPGAPSYPAVFVEDALCINKKLYGVYSANGGFLTYLPEGAYTSAGIGAACNLTVGPNCTITH